MCQGCGLKTNMRFWWQRLRSLSASIQRALGLDLPWCLRGHSVTRVPGRPVLMCSAKEFNNNQSSNLQGFILRRRAPITGRLRGEAEEPLKGSHRGFLEENLLPEACGWACFLSDRPPVFAKADRGLWPAPVRWHGPRLGHHLESFCSLSPSLWAIFHKDVTYCQINYFLL